jgi:hypothetical protein
MKNVPPVITRKNPAEERFLRRPAIRCPFFRVSSFRAFVIEFDTFAPICTLVKVELYIVTEENTEAAFCILECGMRQKYLPRRFCYLKWLLLICLFFAPVLTDHLPVDMSFEDGPIELSQVVILAVGSALSIFMPASLLPPKTGPLRISGCGR